MKIFVDSANVDEIRELNEIGIVDGVTTNPSLIKRSGVNSYTKILQDICSEIEGPVSAEVISQDMTRMVKEGIELSKIADNIVIKVPATMAGIGACRILSQSNKSVNITLCFSIHQAILAAKAGATFISPFVGRMEDKGLNGLELVKGICSAYNNFENIKTQVLVASIRNLKHVEESACMGADVVTLPPRVIWSMAENNLTDEGLAQFMRDWDKPII